MRSQNDIRQDITNAIIDALTNDTLPPWRKPWADDPNSPGLVLSPYLQQNPEFLSPADRSTIRTDSCDKNRAAHLSTWRKSIPY